MWKKGYITILLLQLMLFLAGCGAAQPAKETVQDQGYEATQADLVHGEAPASVPQENGEKDGPKQEPAKEQGTETKSQEKPPESKSIEKAENPEKAPKPEAEQGHASGATPPSRQAPSQGPSKGTSTEPSKETAKETAKDGGQPVYSPPSVSKRPTVTISIQGDEEKGTILPPTDVAIVEGDTVLTVLQKVTKEKNIHLEFSGQGALAYVEGIDHLYEFDRGPMSGWVYRVNGNIVNRSAGVVPVHPGDRVEWLYTMNLGKDLGGR